MKILSPNETINMLGTKEEFEQSRRLDEDGDDLLEDKLKAEEQEEREQDLEDLNEDYDENSGD